MFVVLLASTVVVALETLKVAPFATLTPLIVEFAHRSTVPASTVTPRLIVAVPVVLNVPAPCLTTAKPVLPQVLKVPEKVDEPPLTPTRMVPVAPLLMSS